MSFFLSFYLSLLVSLILEHYTRECEFGNFDKIKKNKKKKKKKENNKKTHKKTHKNFWLNFCLNKDCPRLLCELDIDHRRRQTIPMCNSLGGGRNSSGHHFMSVVCGLSTM